MDYLTEVGDGGEPKGTEVLKEVREFLLNQRNIDNDNDKTPSTLNNTLREIQQSLARIEGTKPITKANNYAAAAIRGQAVEAPPIPRCTKPTAPLKRNELSPQEVRKAREITIIVSKETDKEKLKNMTAKDLVETLQAETEGIRGVSRLISGDLKIHTESAEAKKVLQENSEWTQKIAESAAINMKYKFTL